MYNVRILLIKGAVKMKFKDMLYEIREGKFITRTALAKVINTSRQQISKYESGVSIPSIDVLLKLADYFGVSADYLLGRNDYTTLPKDKKQNYIVFPKELTNEDIDFVRVVINALRSERIKKQNNVSK